MSTRATILYCDEWEIYDELLNNAVMFEYHKGDVNFSCRLMGSSEIPPFMRSQFSDFQKVLDKRVAQHSVQRTDEQISKIADEAIAEGRTYTNYAWHYVGEDTAHQIICDAIRKALQQSEHGDAGCRCLCHRNVGVLHDVPCCDNPVE